MEGRVVGVEGAAFVGVGEYARHEVAVDRIVAVTLQEHFVFATGHRNGNAVAVGSGYAAQGAGDLNRKCIFCHAPHNTIRLSPANGGPGVGSGPQAPDDFDYLPLWNHEMTDNAGSYTMYQNGPGAPTVVSKASHPCRARCLRAARPSLCLSCHDGSVAVNSYGNTSQPHASRSSGGATIDAGYQSGKDNYLVNHHPICFNYDDVPWVDGRSISCAQG